MMMLALMALGLSLLLNAALLRAPAGSCWVVLDQPNARSLHQRAVPRTGGLAIWVASLPLMAWIGAGQVHPVFVWGLIAAVLGVGSVSFLDDRGDVPVGVRLGVHVAAALVLVRIGFRLQLAGGSGWQSAGLDIVSTGSLVWGINLYNFMDGMDGFAGGMAVIGFSVLAAFGMQAGHAGFAEVNLVTAGAALGFLAFNFPPARLFMGDVGSAPLGLLMVASAFWGVRIGCFPLWAPILVFSPFLVDATVTLLARLFRGEPVWRAHRSHYYQRLVQLGWGHRRTVLAEYALMLLAAASAWWGITQSSLGQFVILGAWMTLYGLVGFAVARLETGVVHD